MSNLENFDWLLVIQSNSDKVITPVVLTLRKRIPKFIYLISCFFPLAIITTGTNRYVKKEIKKMSIFILKNTWDDPAKKTVVYY